MIQYKIPRRCLKFHLPILILLKRAYEKYSTYFMLNHKILHILLFIMHVGREIKKKYVNAEKDPKNQWSAKYFLC
jgi:hypothetical protein